MADLTYIWRGGPRVEAPALTTSSHPPVVEVRPSLDLQALSEIARHPEVWATITDDLSPLPQDFQLPPTSLYLGVYTPNLVGFWEARPLSADIFELHSYLLPEARGQIATLALPQALRHLFARTSVMTLVGRVPVTLPAARKFATWAGLRPTHLDPQGWLKGGRTTGLETLYLPLLDWFFRLTTGDVKARARVLISSLAVNGQFVKAEFLHHTLSHIIGDFQGDR